MAILGHRSPGMAIIYSHLSDKTVRAEYERILATGQQVAGPALDTLLDPSNLTEADVDWLKTNFVKTELELGHCLRLPQERPCECDLYLSCAKVITTSAYAPRLRDRLDTEAALVTDARQRGWQREAERHTAIIVRLRRLLDELHEPQEVRPEYDNVSPRDPSSRTLHPAGPSGLARQRCRLKPAGQPASATRSRWGG